MDGTLDAFPFVLAEGLGMTLGQLDAALSPDEYDRWRAFYTYRAAMREHAKEKVRLAARR
jgi:hypothetical protein